MIADRWNVDDAEVARAYPCDGLVAAPTLQAWRGVSVGAPAEVTWRWVAQIRLAPYSYDWVDNLGRRSPQTLLEAPPAVVGDPFTRSGGRPVGRLLAIEEGVHYTGRVLGAVLSYVVVPVGPGSSRLLLKVVMDGHRWLAPFASVGDLFMARRQLLNLARLAEGDRAGC